MIKNLKVTLSLIRCLGLFLALTPSAICATFDSLSFSTLNIRWYGLNGDAMGAKGSESRDQSIRKHLTENNLFTDVMAFQEIVDVEGLQRVVGKNYQCSSYDHVQPRHQHVVVCVKSPLRFVEAEDDNFTYEEISLDHHRPAVHGWVVNTKGKKLAHFVAVHLKAMPNETAKRLTQAELLADALSNMKLKLPTIITGDFNTFTNEHRKIQDIFANWGLNLVEQDSDEPFTFRNSRFQNKFDRVYASGVQFEQSPHVVGPCNGGSTRSEQDRYYVEVSDHCAVTWSIKSQRH